MRTIVHLSDLHFGALAPGMPDAVAAHVNHLRPDLIAISGDLTQRARTSEFEQTRNFLARLGAPKLVVAGNHDVPLYDLPRRFLTPFSRFKRFICSDLMPTWQDSKLFVAGVTSARSLTISGGRLPRSAVRKLTALVPRSTPDPMRILVCHHPVDLDAERGFGGAIDKHIAFPEMASLGFELVLSGHLHIPASLPGTVRWQGDERHVLKVAAGSATSFRLRGADPNSFNVLRIERPQVEVQRWDWDGELGAFTLKIRQFFRHGPKGWEALAPLS